MRYVKLNNRAASGMAARVAIQHMVAARIRANNTPGELIISLPERDGEYWVGFENHAHATAFLDILGRLSVRCEPSQERPDRAIFGRLDLRSQTVHFTGMDVQTARRHLFGL